MDKLYTTRQVSSMLGLHLNRVYDLITSGKLRAYKLGGNGHSKRHWRVYESDLKRFVEANSNVAEAGSSRARENKENRPEELRPSPVSKEADNE